LIINNIDLCFDLYNKSDNNHKDEINEGRRLSLPILVVIKIIGVVMYIRNPIIEYILFLNSKFIIFIKNIPDNNEKIILANL
ncbi:MAG: hypothetical protein WCX33_01175, partial [Candidatus Shapirobacteria bacterium]